MISKETFVNTMNGLQALNDKMDAVDSAFKVLNADFCGFYVTAPFEITLDLLAEAMEDEDDWIYYFAYETDWLRDYKLGDVEFNHQQVKINNWADVYDFMMEVYQW